jgi:hypothetical protein
LSAANGEGQSLDTTGPQDKTKTDTAILPDIDAVRSARDAIDKAFQTDRARAAMNGVELYIVSDGTGGSEYLASRWGWTKTFADLEAVETWLDRIEGRP